MERALLKIVKQINTFDEASFMALWEKYAEKVRNFEPTKRWEEAAIALGVIQSVRLKNQLFNYHWAKGEKPSEGPGIDFLSGGRGVLPPKAEVVPAEDGDTGDEPPKKGKLLKLPDRK